MLSAQDSILHGTDPEFQGGRSLVFSCSRVLDHDIALHAMCNPARAAANEKLVQARLLPDWGPRRKLVTQGNIDLVSSQPQLHPKKSRIPTPIQCVKILCRSQPKIQDSMMAVNLSCRQLLATSVCLTWSPLVDVFSCLTPNLRSASTKLRYAASPFPD